jgi:hypothetical protein
MAREKHGFTKALGMVVAPKLRILRNIKINNIITDIQIFRTMKAVSGTRR